MANDVNNESVGIDGIDWNSIETKEDFDEALMEAFGLDEIDMLERSITQGVMSVGASYMMAHINEMKKSMSPDE